MTQTERPGAAARPLPQLRSMERESVATALDHLEEVIVEIHSLVGGPLHAALVERADDLAGRLKEVLAGLHKDAERLLVWPSAPAPEGSPHVG